MGIEVNIRNMNIAGTHSRFEPLIGNPGDGASPSCALVDEYHEHRDDSLFETMKTGMGARRSPLLCTITTAGVDMGGPCYEKRAEIIKILEGVVTDETIFGIIYCADESDEWDSDAAMIKANPNIDISVYRRYLETERDQARRSASKQNSYRTKHLNQWVGAKTAWMNMVAWQRQKRTLRLEDFIGKRCHIGVDLASKIDIAAVVLVFNENDEYQIFSKFYAPEAAAELRSRYQNYETDGFMTLTAGTSTDFATIEEDIAEFGAMFNVLSVGFDEWQARYMAQRLIERHKMNMVQVPHQVRIFSSPMKSVESLILDAKMVHDGNPCMTWQIGNVVAKLDAKDNVYPRKEAAKNKIDGAVGLIMAMAGWELEETEKTVNIRVL